MEIVDQFGKPMSPVATARGSVPDGASVRWETSDRDGRQVSRGLDPELVDSILRQADVGITDRQCMLAAEIEEKNWDIAQACQTRRSAVAGLEWRVEPGGDAPADKEAAERLGEQLLGQSHFLPVGARFGTEPQHGSAGMGQEFSTFAELVAFEMMGALLPGFSVTEIIWANGGAEIAGFNAIEARHFTFRDSRRPLLVTRSQPLGVPLAPNKFIYHRHASRSGDASRGGLIRPLCWLDVFMRLGGMKDLLRFTERYGMPFLVAKVNAQAWESDRNKLRALIQNFGSDGGAILTDAVTTELIQASNATGDVYYKLLAYAGDAITKVILGQTASSGDSAGLSGGDAQSKVRGDLLKSDAGMIGATLRSQVAAPWTQFNYGSAAKVPKIRAVVEKPEDLVQTSTVLVNLNNAGFDADEQEMSEKFGMKLTRKPLQAGGANFTPPAPPEGASGTVGDSAVAPDAGAMAGGQPAAASVQDTAFNGAQVTAAAQVVKDVAAGLLPRETGVMMLVQFFRMSTEDAEKMMGTTGAGFKPADSAALSAELRPGLRGADSPVAGVLAEIEVKAADSAVSDADLLKFVEAKITQIPGLFGKMDTSELAAAFEFGMLKSVVKEMTAAGKGGTTGGGAG